MFGGNSHWELGVEEPFNGENKCRSSANKDGYRIGEQDGINMLTNLKDGYFTITEIEVWEVEF